MSTTAVPEVAVTAVDEGFWTRNRKIGAVLLALGVLAAVLFGAGGRPALVAGAASDSATPEAGEPVTAGTAPTRP